MRDRMGEAARAMHGEVTRGDAATTWEGIALDSRRIEGDELFFALSGERTDGHRFVADALRRGAAGAVVERQPDGLSDGVSEGALIGVADAYIALHDLTRWARSRNPQHVVGITGSAGKTSTKDLLTPMLSARFRVACNPGNYNNLLGFPIALLGIPEDTEWMVAEMGMSTPGELGQVSRLGRPQIAVYTNVAPVHLERLGSLERIADAKAELLEGLEPDGVVVANADDPQVVAIAARHRGTVVTYAVHADADHRAVDLQPIAGGGTRFRWIAPAGEVDVELSLLGEHNVHNFLAAAACATHLGVPMSEVAAVAQQAEASAMRGVVHSLEDGTTIVDDSYNSNPEAVVRALSAVRALAGKRHWAVLGSMLELGPKSAEFHRQVGVEVAGQGFSLLLGVGDDAAAIVDAAAAAGVESYWVADRDAAAIAAVDHLRPADVVLVKGSRGVGLERVVAALTGEGAG